MTTRNHVLKLRSKYPCITLQSIGDKVGISRERVRQILQSENKQTRALRPQSTLYRCPNCGTITKLKFCSSKCRYEYHNPLVECKQCGKLFRRRSSELCRKRYNKLAKTGYFCSRQCLGKWLGTNYGSKGNNNLKKGRNRKYDYESIWQKHLETGFGSHRLSQLLHIPYSSIDEILRKMRQKTGIKVKIAPGIACKRIMIRWLSRLNFTRDEILKMTGCSSSYYDSVMYRNLNQTC